MKSLLSKLWFILVLIFFLMSSFPLTSHATLYGITFNSEFITIDETTGVGTLVDYLDPFTIGHGIADYNGNIYTFEQFSDVIVQIDPLTGDILATYDVGLTGLGLSGEGSIAFDAGGTGYLVSTVSTGPSASLYSFDLSTGESQFIRSLDHIYDGLDFNPTNGLFYGKEQLTGEIHFLDPITFNVFAIGINPIEDTNALSGLTFDNLGNIYYENRDYLWVNGTQSPNPTGFAYISGLTYVTSVPDASIMLLLGPGLVGLAGFGRKRFKN
jgi:hypothetical protein